MSEQVKCRAVHSYYAPINSAHFTFALMLFVCAARLWCLFPVDDGSIPGWPPAFMCGFIFLCLVGLDLPKVNINRALKNPDHLQDPNRNLRSFCWSQYSPLLCHTTCSHHCVNGLPLLVPLRTRWMSPGCASIWAFDNTWSISAVVVYFLPVRTVLRVWFPVPRSSVVSWSWVIVWLMDIDSLAVALFMEYFVPTHVALLEYGSPRFLDALGAHFFAMLTNCLVISSTMLGRVFCCLHNIDKTMSTGMLVIYRGCSLHHL